MTTYRILNWLQANGPFVVTEAILVKSILAWNVMREEADKVYN